MRTCRSYSVCCTCLHRNTDCCHKDQGLQIENDGKVFLEMTTITWVFVYHFQLSVNTLINCCFPVVVYSTGKLSFLMDIYSILIYLLGKVSCILLALRVCFIKYKGRLVKS